MPRNKKASSSEVPARRPGADGRFRSSPSTSFSPPPSVFPGADTASPKLVWMRDPEAPDGWLRVELDNRVVHDGPFVAVDSDAAEIRAVTPEEFAAIGAAAFIPSSVAMLLHHVTGFDAD